MTSIENIKSLPQAWEGTEVQSCVEGFSKVLSNALKTTWLWVCSTHSLFRARSDRSSLRVAESVSLGEKRAIYVIEVDDQRLLVGASATGLTLLSQLVKPKEDWQNAVKDLVFANVMHGCEKNNTGGKTTQRNGRTMPPARQDA